MTLALRRTVFADGERRAVRLRTGSFTQIGGGTTHRPNGGVADSLAGARDGSYTGCSCLFRRRPSSPDTSRASGTSRHGRDTTTRRCEIIGLLKVGCFSRPSFRCGGMSQTCSFLIAELMAPSSRSTILDARGVRNVAVRSAPRLPWKRLCLVEAYRPNAWPAREARLRTPLGRIAVGEHGAILRGAISSSFRFSQRGTAQLRQMRPLVPICDEFVENLDRFSSILRGTRVELPPGPAGKEISSRGKALT
jgi:hypothetical protein